MPTLLFDLRRVRQQGWVLPRFCSCMLRPVRGVLRVTEQRLNDMHRSARVAELLDPATGHPLADVPPLIDAVLLAADGAGLTITGVERILEGERVIDYAQTWLLDAVTEG